MSLVPAKYMGGVGALLLVIGGIGAFGTLPIGLLGIVGIILILIALKNMADFYSERGIFNDALYAVIAGIVGLVAFFGALIVAFLTFVGNLPDWARVYVDARDWQGLSNAIRDHVMDFNSFWELFGSVVVTLILALVVLFVFAVVAMVFFRRSLGLLSSKTHVGLFGTSGLLMLIGAILIIAFGLGLILIWISWILLTIAFFSIRETAAAPTPAQPAPTTPPAAPQ